MKKRNIFDTIGTLPENIDISSEDNSVNVENIRGKVFDKIHSTKKKTKKPMKKRFAITLIAAALTVAILGTVTAGAMGSFNTAIGEHFAGETLDGVYSGGDVNIQTAEGIDAELMGVAGDNNSAMGLIRLRKSDGSDFVSNYNESIVVNNDAVDCVLNKNLDLENIDVKELSKKIEEADDTTSDIYPLVFIGQFSRENDAEDEAYMEVPYFKQLQNRDYWFKIKYPFNPGSERLPLYDDYKITDNKSISCYYMFNFGYGINTGGIKFDPKGEMAHISNNKIYVYEIEKVLYNGYIVEVLNDPELMLNILKENASDINGMKEDQVMTYDFVSCRWMIATKKVINIDLNASFRMNYKDSVVDMPATDSVLSYDNIKYTVESIHCGPFVTTFSIKLNNKIEKYDITEEQDFDKVYYSNYQNEWLSRFGIESDIKVNLKNGKTVKAAIDSVEHLSESEENDGTINCMLGYFDNDGISWITINPQEISSIEIGGQKITAE